MKKFLSSVINISLIIILLLTSLEFTSADNKFYHDFQVKYDISHQAGISQQELDKVSSDLIKYLKLGDTGLLNSHFNEREVSHMEDVYKLFFYGRVLRNSLIIIAICLFYVIVKKFDLLESLKSINNMFLPIASILLVLLVIAVMNFSEVFIKFHHIFFKNDLWLMDPSTDMMIRMLPNMFFKKMVIKTIVIFCISLFAIQSLLYFFRKGISK